jgi:hypothetical protein
VKLANVKWNPETKFTKLVNWIPKIFLTFWTFVEFFYEVFWLKKLLKDPYEYYWDIYEKLDSRRNYLTPKTLTFQKNLTNWTFWSFVIVVPGFLNALQGQAVKQGSFFAG